MLQRTLHCPYHRSTSPIIFDRLICGHSSCERCLYAWFRRIRDDYIRDVNGSYTLLTTRSRPLVEEALRLTRARRPEEVVYESQRKAMDAVNDSPQPPYTCPNCLTRIRHPPSRAFTIESIVIDLDPQASQDDNQRVDWSQFFIIFT